MKKNIIIIIIILLSCNSQQEKSISSAKVNYVSIGEGYGKLYKCFNVIETNIKYDEFEIFIYNDSTNYKRIDTLKFFYDGKVIFNSVKAENVDSKNVTNKNKILFLQKIYISHKGDISVDDFSGEIIYFTKDGIVARYGTSSNYISLYRPDLYSELHNKILYRKLDFKRHSKELGELP